ncbi:MAG: mechanosensitive ion channel protein MscS [Thiobacillus sp. 63-78]|uniref:mechanosensitive ion channel family protein n=1 Tax=Thiobacillus sp. 63-78 TaxID=1895859 RepID=UPI0009626C7F|nr:mechanosensitive ion channel family protein [Thiobacillus sp. 63-78]MBN8764083.1 mechanosensitive ion channel family protein [Thiobacillus sp.]OJZ16506.1 MAG: mechanosensitive ion channel protein MscS [Thiobacillus sp. 63-78]
MNDLIQRLDFSFLAASWMQQAMTVVGIVILFNIAAWYLLRHIEKITARTATIWDDALVKATRKPLTLILWVTGATYVIRIVYQHLGIPVHDVVLPTRNTLIIAALAWFLLRLIRQASHNILAHRARTGRSVDSTTVDALSKLGRVSVFVVAVLAIMQNLGFSVSGVLAFGGIGGIAVGFAAKDMLANFFGGLTIYLDRPFTVGEWIRSPDHQIEGTVEYIGWRHTRVRAFNKNPIYVPNALFTTIVVENPTRMTNRRIKETIGIRYVDLDKMAAIVADVKAMLQAHPEIDTNAVLIVNFNQFAASSLDFLVYAFTKTVVWVQFHEVKQDVLLKIAAIIEAHGAKIAIPARTLYLESPTATPTPGQE